MEVQAILDLINSTAFPIVAFLLLFYYINTSTRELTNAVNTMKECVTSLETMIKTFHGGE